MEELKLLVQMVADLPQMVLWVIAAYFFYKITVVGSIYGVIRFVAQKIHDVLVHRKTLIEEGKVINPKALACINEDVEHELMKQLRRVQSTGYMHMSDVQKLAKLIDSMK